MKFIKKHIVFIAIVSIFLILIIFSVITYRNIGVSEMITSDTSWNYKVKSIVFHKTVSSEVIDSKYSHSTTVSIGGNSDSSGIVPPGSDATAKVTGSPLKTAYVYWDVIDSEENQQ